MKRYREDVSTQLDTPGSDQHGLDEFAAAIDRDAEVPIGLQLGWALCARIHDGEFRPGQRLPGLREMAQASGLNVNTVRAVYQRLEQRGLLESRQGSGTFVSSTLPRPSAVGTIAADAAREAEAIGVDPREVAAALYVAMPRGDAPVAADVPSADRAGAETAKGQPGAETAGAAARRRALRAQIATLERAIGEIEAEHPGVAPRPTATRRGPGPTLLSAEELEGVRSGLVRRLAQVQRAIDERTTGAQSAAQGPVETATDPALAKRRTTVALATP
jgi:DNA-binding transcriptional regulator YhcF (GntR family)